MADLNTLVIDDGSEKVSIKNKYGDEIGVFYFNPTDLHIIDRYNNAVHKFEKIAENMTDDADSLKNAEIALYDAFNDVFGGDVKEGFFKKVHPFTPINGGFYCEAVIDAIGKYITSRFEQEVRKHEKRVAKYVKGYKK